MMQILKLSTDIEIRNYLQDINVDAGGVNILASKAKLHYIAIKKLPVGGANILKQDALSIGADLAVPRGTVIASEPYVDCILIASTKQLRVLAKKELAQPFALKEVAHKLKEFLDVVPPKSVEIMGIINANDDSFFSGSRFVERGAVERIESMIQEGAHIIDIGGVSSRPNAPTVSAREELERVKPILDTIKAEGLYERVDFSIDSFAPSVISYAFESGFKILNDITGLEDDEVCKLCADYQGRAVIMHMQGTPQTMQEAPSYENVLVDVYDFLEQRLQKAESFGIKDIVLDVGIGFGKTLEHNLLLVKHLEHFLTLNKSLLVGVSRKSLIDKIVPSSVEKRLPGTLALHLESVKNGASILRVHDVAEHVQALKVQEALKNI